jgi:adhesin transport system outer membrane protein
MQHFLKAGLRSVSLIVFCSFVHASVQPDAVRTVEQTVHLALASHPKFQASRQQAASTGEQLRQIESAFLPQISVNLGIGREDSNNATTRALNGSGSIEVERREATLQLSQMLFDGFETDNLRKGQLQSLKAENWALQDIASELTLRAIKTHLQVATSNQLLSDHLENLKVHEQIARDIGVRVRSGKDDRARVSQISARLSLALANLEAARSQVLSANADYLREVGTVPGEQLLFQNGLIPMPETEQTLLESVLSDHPLLQSRLNELEARQFQEKASRSHALPELYLESGASWNANIDAVRGRNSDAFVMLRMRYDLFRGGADLSAEREAAHATQQVRFELDDLRRELQREASRAWFSYQSNARRVGFLQDYVESAQATKQAYVKQFNIGQRSLIDLLDAENELLRARIQWHEARESLALSKYQILNLQGGLLSLFSIHPDSMIAGSGFDQNGE